MMRHGIVVEVHPEDHSVDLVMADDGARLTGVQVLTGNGSTRSGTVDLPKVVPKGNKWDITQRTGQDMLAIVGYVGRHPVVVGFKFPQVNQMTHRDPKLRLSRHQSDVISMIDGDGNTQWLHPSGAFIRVGEAPERAVPDVKDEDGLLAIDRNVDRKVFIRVQLADNVVRLTMTPDGDVDLELVKDLHVHAGGNAAVEIDGNVDIVVGGHVNLTAGGAVTVTAPSVTLDTPSTHVTGNLTVDGSTSVQAIESRGKDVSSTHRHANSGGPSVGGVPV